MFNSVETPLYSSGISLLHRGFCQYYSAGISICIGVATSGSSGCAIPKSGAELFTGALMLSRTSELDDTCARGINAVRTIQRTMSEPASVHVAFSRKSVVLRTPSTWLEEEKPDARPPPLEFWTNTINTNTTEQIRIKIEIKTYISLFFYVNNFFQIPNLVCKVNIFFRIFQT